MSRRAIKSGRKAVPVFGLTIQMSSWRRLIPKRAEKFQVDYQGSQQKL